jgi:hypothetical protein
MDLRVGKNYQLVKKVGSGAFGEIFEGKTQPYLYNTTIRPSSLNKAVGGHQACKSKKWM